MAGVTEYRNEQFIQQYEHISKLNLLSDGELSQVKRKRSLFEVSIKNCSEIKPFIDYIKFEIALMKKFRQLDYENEDDCKALDRVMAFHVKDLFRLSLKKFSDKRKIWEHYIAFTKQKFFNQVTGIYQEMLNFHHKTEDFIEAAEHEMSRGNFTVAMNFLVQGMAMRKEDCSKLVVIYIECSLQQGVNESEDAKEATLSQASKFYEKFLKGSSDVPLLCRMLQKIQSFDYAIDFQNAVLNDLMVTHVDRAEVWNLLAKRHLDGIFYEVSDSEKVEDPKESKAIPFDVCLRQAFLIFDKSLDIVATEDKQKMFSLYIDQLLELDERKDISGNCLKLIRLALCRTMIRGYKENNLTVVHFICLLKLKMLNMKKEKSEIEEMLLKGQELYPNSMDLYELAIKYCIETENYESITGIFNFAVCNNEKNAIELYRFLCGVYLNNPKDKEKAITTMIDAVNSNNKQLSEAFQPYYIEYHALTDSIEKSREVFIALLSSKTMGSLSLDFFKTMIKMEAAQEKPDHKKISNCYERATEHFGKENPEVSLTESLI